MVEALVLVRFQCIPALFRSSGGIVVGCERYDAPVDLAATLIDSSQLLSDIVMSLVVRFVNGATVGASMGAQAHKHDL